MAKNFPEIAFTKSVKAQQERYGSRERYERMEALAGGTELSYAEADFIGLRDSFYMASIGEHGYPYVQFRGGAKGFLKVLDAKTLGWADFRGNLQYISVGNLGVNNKAALILMDYPNRKRLKIYATVKIVDARHAPDIIERLTVADYKAKIERAFVLRVEAFDWNCPQHITPRYTLDEVGRFTAPLYDQIKRLETENEKLRNSPRELQPLNELEFQSNLST